VILGPASGFGNLERLDTDKDRESSPPIYSTQRVGSNEERSSYAKSRIGFTDAEQEWPHACRYDDGAILSRILEPTFDKITTTMTDSDVPDEQSDGGPFFVD
jgi:hypothetical protein